ncbi:MAG: putative transcription activator [Firmicutes bacterium]|nr:putative transcription activator [Bacillota bacterium]
MSKLIRFEVKRFPAVRLIGKKVRMSLNPEGDNMTTNLWSRMWQDGSMDFLGNIPGRLTEERDTIGWIGDFDLQGSTCEYIAGVLTKAGTSVPTGYISRDLPECLMGVGWIQGREEDADLYAGAHEQVIQAMKEYGYDVDPSAGGYEMQYYSFHRFGVPRYMGEKILIMDYYCPCKKLPTENDRKEIEMVKDMGKVRKDFDSLAQRCIYGYKSTYPICIPIEDDRVSETSQRQMHGFLQEVINRIYNNPSLVNLQQEKDEFYEVWMLNNSKPELDDKMRKTEKVLFDFYAYLYKLGECGEVKDNKLYVDKGNMKFVKKRLLQLEQFGLFSQSTDTSTIFYSKEYPELFPAWKLLYDKKANSPKGEIVRFLYCMYDSMKYSAEHLFGNIIDDSTLLKELEQFFEGIGFHRYFDEAGIHWDKEYRDKQKGNAVFSFSWKRREQMTFSFRVPNFRLVLNHFDEMSNELKELTFSRTKNCDSCGYCTQMDKTGMRLPLALNLECNGNKSGKCPLFPNLTWRYIDKKEVENIKGLFDFAETVSKIKRS